VVVGSRGGESLVVEEGVKAESLEGVVDGTEEVEVVKEEDEGKKGGVEKEGEGDEDEEVERLKGLLHVFFSSVLIGRVHLFTPFISPRLHTGKQASFIL
jgi:hypothetical protein